MRLDELISAETAEVKKQLRQRRQKIRPGKLGRPDLSDLPLGIGGMSPLSGGATSPGSLPSLSKSYRGSPSGRNSVTSLGGMQKARSWGGLGLQSALYGSGGGGGGGGMAMSPSAGSLGGPPGARGSPGGGIMTIDELEAVEGRIEALHVELRDMFKALNGLRTGQKEKKNQLAALGDKLGHLLREDDVEENTDEGLKKLEVQRKELGKAQHMVQSCIDYREQLDRMKGRLQGERLTFEKTLKAYEEALEVRRAEASSAKMMCAGVQQERINEERELSRLKQAVHREMAQWEEELEQRRERERRIQAAQLAAGGGAGGGAGDGEISAEGIDELEKTEIRGLEKDTKVLGKLESIKAAYAERQAKEAARKAALELPVEVQAARERDRARHGRLLQCLGEAYRQALGADAKPLATLLAEDARAAAHAAHVAAAHHAAAAAAAAAVGAGEKEEEGEEEEEEGRGGKDKGGGGGRGSSNLSGSRSGTSNRRGGRGGGGVLRTELSGMGAVVKAHHEDVANFRARRSALELELANSKSRRASLDRAAQELRFFGSAGGDFQRGALEELTTKCDDLRRNLRGTQQARDAVTNLLLAIRQSAQSIFDKLGSVPFAELLQSQREAHSGLGGGSSDPYASEPRSPMSPKGRAARQWDSAGGSSSRSLTGIGGGLLGIGGVGGAGGGGGGGGAGGHGGGDAIPPGGFATPDVDLADMGLDPSAPPSGAKELFENLGLIGLKMEFLQEFLQGRESEKRRNRSALDDPDAKHKALNIKDAILAANVLNMRIGGTKMTTEQPLDKILHGSSLTLSIHAGQAGGTAAAAAAAAAAGGGGGRSESKVVDAEKVAGADGAPAAAAAAAADEA